MNTKHKRRPVTVINGEAIDQETIIRQRPLIEDYVRNDMRIKFRKTKVFWDMNNKGYFNFSIEFYA